jgi:hypothetical protein
MKPAAKSVAFAPPPKIRSIAPRPRPRKSVLNMDEKVFRRFDGDRVTDEMLEEASKLFSENYGIWSEHAAEMMGAYAKAGRPAYIQSCARALIVC